MTPDGLDAAGLLVPTALCFGSLGFLGASFATAMGVGPSIVFLPALLWLLPYLGVEAASVASIAVGVAAAFGMTFVFPAVFDERQLQAVTNRPVIGSVSVALDAAGQRAHRWQLVQFGGTAGLLLISSVAWLGWVVVSSRI